MVEKKVVEKKWSYWFAEKYAAERGYKLTTIFSCEFCPYLNEYYKSRRCVVVIDHGKKIVEVYPPVEGICPWTGEFCGE